MLKTISAAFVATAMLATSASAATLGGFFEVTVYNVTNLTGAESQATKSNLDAAEANTLGGEDSVITGDIFTFDGMLDFGTFDHTDATTISDWLATSGGTVNGLDIGDLQLSKPNIGDGTATSTFFYFDLIDTLGANDFVVRHDDGMTIYDDGEFLGGRVGPNSVKTTEVLGFDGGEFGLLYVATNGDPSVLHVDATPVPLPAGLPLILAGLGGLALVRRRANS